MFPLDHVLAVAVLAAPGPVGPAPELASLSIAIRQVALGAEVLDPREVQYVLAGAVEFECDLQLLRRRWRDLADAPPVIDALRFPPRQVAAELLSFNRAYRAHLAAREMVEGSARDELGKALEEADQLYRVWDAVRDARSECYYVSVRRQALLTLQSALGPAAYFQGALPPHVPVWRFARRD
jgi:hypothetical protein